MRTCFAGTRAVLVTLALSAGLAGCAGRGERLPECKGKPVPINTLARVAVPVAPSSHAHAR